jgi:hypothetical protein
MTHLSIEPTPRDHTLARLHFAGLDQPTDVHQRAADLLASSVDALAASVRGLDVLRSYAEMRRMTAVVAAYRTQIAEMAADEAADRAVEERDPLNDADIRCGTCKKSQLARRGGCTCTRTIPLPKAAAVTTQSVVVWKHRLPDLVTALRLPVGATVLHVAAQGRDMLLWEAHPVNSAATETRTFVRISTGSTATVDVQRYVGTVHMDNGDVAHVFEVDGDQQ